MTLDQFIISIGTSETALALKAGCSQSTISKMRRGVGNWTIGMIQRVSKATKGQVSVEEIIASKPREKRRLKRKRA